MITTIVYALIVPVFFEMDIAFGEGENFVDDIDIEKMTSNRQQVEMETECKSPCPSSAEMCIAICVNFFYFLY